MLADVQRAETFTAAGYGVAHAEPDAGEYGTNLSLCVDEVDGIGAFLELERLASEQASSEAVQAELAAFAESLSVPATRVSQTYDSLVHAARK